MTVGYTKMCIVNPTPITKKENTQSRRWLEKIEIREKGQEKQQKASRKIVDLNILTLIITLNENVLNI